MAEIEIREGKLYVNGLQLSQNPQPSSTGKSLLLVSQTSRILDENGDDVKVQVTAYKKA